MTRHPVWDPFVRIFHWTLVLAFAANALLTDPESNLHEWVGYIALGLVGLRLIWGVIGARHARFSDFIPTPAAIMRQLQDMATGRHRIHLGHTPLGALMIFNLLATLLAIGATGYLMTTNAFWGVKWVKEMHEVFVVWAEISVVAHVGAVIFESMRTGVNLPRAMVSGVKSVPKDATLVE